MLVSKAACCCLRLSVRVFMCIVFMVQSIRISLSVGEME